MDRSGSAESPFMGSLSGLAGTSPLGGGRGNLGSPFTSPFLDPSFTRSPTIANEYIFPDGGTKASRGRFEMAFAQIGASVFLGGGIGGTIGFGKGQYTAYLFSPIFSYLINSNLIIFVLCLKF